ncbi:hypothetical protein THRCLA_07807 [Thraustotheca clavata]|uniref:Uncharacterized protein n=1 Tax=Thraustotheca clavata TaxID=74557 RepID=A0A1V9ZBY7_9STRA|nr:hypothetical protein THRCLA_07807 [Thraustotheca clavata]
MPNKTDEICTTESHKFPPEERCKYAYKECKEQRSRRKNGKLHSLCDYHRKKANSVQKSYATKRRNMQQRNAAAAKIAGDSTRLPSTTSSHVKKSYSTPPPPQSYAIPSPVLYAPEPPTYDMEHAMRLEEIKRRIQAAWERRHLTQVAASESIYFYSNQHSFLLPLAQTNQ